MDSCRRTTGFLLSIVPFLVPSMAILSVITVGCERSMQPPGQPLPPDTPRAVEVWVQGVAVARFDQPQVVEALLAALPRHERTRIGNQGHCVTRDPTFRQVLHHFLATDSTAGKGGFSGHIRDATWGEIKIVMAGRRG